MEAVVLPDAFRIEAGIDDPVGRWRMGQQRKSVVIGQDCLNTIHILYYK